MSVLLHSNDFIALTYHAFKLMLKTGPLINLNDYLIARWCDQVSIIFKPTMNEF